MKQLKIWLFVLIFWSTTANAAIHILAGENIYGITAKQLGGQYVVVTNILNNPNQDPHLFSVTPSILKMAKRANIIVYNGANYDPWMNTLLHSINDKQTVIAVSNLVHTQVGDNPHIWYQPETVLLFARTLTEKLCLEDPQHKPYFKKQLIRFEKDYRALLTMVSKLKTIFAGTPIIATEPIFNDMAKHIGLTVHAISFQRNIMNDTPPSISEIKQFESDLRQHAVRVLIYNSQVITPITTRLRDIAQAENIPTVGMGEMLPPNTTYIPWMLGQLRNLEEALKLSQKGI